MKKNILLLVFGLFMNLGCSNNDDQPQAVVSNNLLKKIILDFNDGNQLVKNTSILTYDGNKLIQVTDNSGFKGKYTYNGNLITKIENINGTVSIITTFEYFNNKLLSSIENNSNDGYKTQSTYAENNDGTINCSINFIDKISNTVSTGETYKLTFLNRNLVKKENISLNPIRKVTIYLHDNKNSYLQGIAGFDKFYDSGSDINNLIKQTETKTTTDASGIVNTQVDEFSLNFIYNANNFPVNGVYTNGTFTANYQFFYD